MRFAKSTAAYAIQFLATLQLGLSGIAQAPAPVPSQPQATHPAVHSHRLVDRGQSPVLPALCATCVRSNLSYLAGPTMHGRGSGTEDEHTAAEFIAATLNLHGLKPAAGDGKYIQGCTLRSREVTGNPTLTIKTKGEDAPNPLVLTHGNQMVLADLSQAHLAAPLQKIDLNDEGASPGQVVKGAALLVKLKTGTSPDDASKILGPYRSGDAAMVVIASSSYPQRTFDTLAKEPPRIPQVIGNDEPKPRAMLVIAKQEAFDQIWAEPQGATVLLQAEISPWKTTNTWNVLARIEGTSEKEQIVLLSAHLDHLGVKGGQTYYGADDDASGTVAVMELARALAKEPKPTRTVIVALWGSEEAGLIGARYFLQNPTFPIKDIVANLEFEMIGRPDPRLKPDQLWLTGWERTDLGPELSKHGAKLVGDPRPAEKFFTRSDNYALAKEGIVAQTVSSFGVHADYHQPTDTLDKIDFEHMDRAIASMIGPVTWLANTDFKPEWLEGKKP